jgi:two-component sensor histidine kinase/PAS domain-containing protein
MESDDLFFASFDEAVPPAAEVAVPDAPRAIREATSETALREELERRQRDFDLAMTASQMGTWRYTIADNICVYDANAQQLYGLSEARFLHDEAGVKTKFHADDMELMWSRVARALDPAGDGRYDVEYRVRQPDGSWRWLSAWGLVEFEGEGPHRRAVAISGASRDLTERKQAEDFQRMLLDELNHRVKNTLATVHAITAQTLRHASDLPSARVALEQRIMSMSRAHDLLTARTWTGADFADVVARTLEAFPREQVKTSGPALDLPSRHVLALSLALHEMATNAVKYGALSCPEGQVAVSWSADAGELRIRWEERGGPPVAQPVNNGFGTRLLQQLVGDLGGTIELEYAPTGLRCHLSAGL